MSVFDITPLRQFSEDLMTDSCRILTDPDDPGAGTDTVNADGSVTEADTATVTFWEGPCRRVFEDTIAEYPETDGGRQLTPARTGFRIPVSAPIPSRGMTIVLTGCPTDPQAVGKRYRILTVGAGTLSVARLLLTEDAW